MDEREIISQIRNLKDDEVEQWIEERLQFLESTTEEKREELSMFYVNMRRLKGEKENTEIHGYIPSKTRIKKMMVDIGAFNIDDRDIYRTIVEYIRNSDPKYVTNNTYMMHLIQCELINYFGYRGIEEVRDALYDTKSIDDNVLSIKEFKKNGTAMCVERSAVGQNLLAFLGYDPMMIYGYVSSNNGVTNEAHAYNCIIRDGKAMLVDFTNPIYKDGKYHHPACFPIDLAHLEAFKKGNGQIEVERKDLITVDGDTRSDITSVVYASDEIDEKFFANQNKDENKNNDHNNLEESR